MFDVYWIKTSETPLFFEYLRFLVYFFAIYFFTLKNKAQNNGLFFLVSLSTGIIKENPGEPIFRSVAHFIQSHDGSAKITEF